ncbi:MAG: hypoxanthine phosphoribosyltransferase [Desulfatiglandales bacterium]
MRIHKPVRPVGMAEIRREFMEQEPETKTLVFSRDLIRERVREIAKAVSEKFTGKEPVFIGILNGAVFFFGDLVRELTIPCRIDFIRAASYGAGTVSSGEIRFTKDIEIDIAGEPVIVVEDIIDTGRTLKRILRHVEKKGADPIHVCVLIDKRERREEEVPIDYSGFRVDRGFLVGYGLDCNERFRHLPDIYALD